MKGDRFYLYTPSGIHSCEDRGDPYMIDYRVLYDTHGMTGAVGRINKRLLSHCLLTDDRWDIRPTAQKGYIEQ